jgi:hypothetical protein
MKPPFRACAALALIALPFVAGCGNKVTAPPAGMTANTADDIAVQAVAGLSVVSGDIQFAITTTPQSAPSGTRRVRPLAMPARALWDTTFAYGGITYEASRSFYDAADNLLPGYDPQAVRLHWTSRAYGTYEGPRDTASVGHDALLDVRGIQFGQDTLQFDGACHDTLQNSFRSLDGTRQRYFLWVSSSTVSGVHILKSSTTGWPLDGTATFTVSADRLRTNNRTDVEAHFDALVVVTFNGTSQATIVVSGSYIYQWNLLTGSITRG